MIIEIKDEEVCNVGKLRDTAVARVSYKIDDERDIDTTQHGALCVLIFKI